MALPVTLLSAPANAKLTARIRADLETAGITVHESVQPGRDALLVVVFSPQARDDRTIQQGIIEALDQYQHVIPVLAESVTLPRLIDNLQPVDFTSRYAIDDLITRIHALSAPDAPPPLKALTPSQRAANRRTGLITGVVGMIMFVVAIILIAVFGYGPPEDEFAGVETQIFLTRNWYIDEALPRSTEDAAAFEATLERARPSVQPYLAATATAIAEGVQGSFVPQSSAEATNFEATARMVSTIVREELVATVTAAAASAESNAGEQGEVTEQP